MCKPCKKEALIINSRKHYAKIQSERKRYCKSCDVEIISGRTYCDVCARNRTREKRITHDRANTENRRLKGVNLKRKAVEYKGGKCIDCGLQTDKYIVYDFHHLDPKLKDVKIAEMIHKRKNFEVIKIELDKCVLLCSNCHRIRHDKDVVL